MNELTKKAWLIAACLPVVTVLAASCGSSFQVSVTSWKVGSSTVSGTIDNATGSGCTDPEVTLHLRDHNDAIVRDFTFGAGELAAGQSKNWSTDLVGLLDIETPVPSNVTSINADASCADQH